MSETSVDTATSAAHPERFLIICTDVRRLPDYGTTKDTTILEEFIKEQNLNLEHAVHVGTLTTSERVYIIIDYKNPNGERCGIRGFKKSKRYIKELHLTSEMVADAQRRADEWRKQILPVRSEACRSP